MSNAIFQVPTPINEPVRGYAPGSPERASLQSRLKTMSGEQIELPLVIGGKRISTGDTGPMVMPHAHKHKLGSYHKAKPEHVEQAVEAARRAQPE
ncbi:MAG: 1-pyrroline-5-carboxylate dehydrogenase, partial [Candidatus Eremiobacteraeota bacterium]|nr:1-pyrroline-5-carboxylate dehydrogenase [Candidatus Eremiobacteraeota bacterium]